jgi:hypothetical protein
MMLPHGPLRTHGELDGEKKVTLDLLKETPVVSVTAWLQPQFD